MSDTPFPSTFRKQLLSHRIDFLVNREARERHPAIILRVPSDTMSPVIRPADCIIAQPVGEWKGDGIYVYRLQEVINIYQLQRLPGHITRVSSPNRYYRGYDLKPEHDWDPLAVVTGHFRALYLPSND